MGVKCFVTLAFLCSVSFAEISIGADIISSFNSYNNEAESSAGITTEIKSNRNTISIAPMIGIIPSKLIEIAPFFRWGVTTYSSETTSGISSKTENTQHSIEPGCGVYFHVANNNNMLDFSLGPKLSYAWSFKPYSNNTPETEYDKYYNGTLNFGVQTNIDLKFSEHFKTRFFSNLFRLYLLNTTNKLKGATVENRRTDFLSDFRTILQPSFGFHFTF